MPGKLIESFGPKAKIYISQEKFILRAKDIHEIPRNIKRNLSITLWGHWYLDMMCLPDRIVTLFDLEIENGDTESHLQDELIVMCVGLNNKPLFKNKSDN